MQDDITMPPKAQLNWLLKTMRMLSCYDFRKPLIITGYRASFYRYHDWFWNVGSQRACNDNGWWQGS